MNKVKEYNDFIVDLIFEGAGSSGLLPFVFTKEFEKIISGINHPIASDLLSNENQSEAVTLIDVSEESDKISFSTSPKIIEYLMDYNKKPKEEVMGIDFYTYLRKSDDIWTKYRSTMKIGKLIKKLFEDKYPDNGRPGRDIESFVNAYKFVFNKDEVKELFDLVKGNDIVEWYDYGSYGMSENSAGSPIHQSCMAHDCENFLRFYAKNPDHINMLILYENDKKRKIVGRALIWYLDEPEGRVFMDRVYTVHEYQVSLFTDYATEKGWLFKSSQTYGGEPIVDPKTGEKVFIEMTVKDIKLNDEYPYMDTMRYLDQDKKILSTERISDVKLIETDGGAYDCEWSNRYERWINIDHLGEDGEYVLCEIGKERYSDDIDNVRRQKEARYLPYYGEWVSKEKYKDLIVTATLPRNHEMLKSDCVYLKHYGIWAEENFADKKLKFSFYEDDYFEAEDVVMSNKMESLVRKDTSTKVYTDIDRTETDYIPDKELDELTYTSKGDYILKK